MIVDNKNWTGRFSTKGSKGGYVKKEHLSLDWAFGDDDDHHATDVFGTEKEANRMHKLPSECFKLRD